MKTKHWRRLSILLAVLLALSALAACGSAAKTGSAAAETGYHSLSDFAGKRIGVLTGAVQGPVIEKEIPTAKLQYFNLVPDLLAAVRLGKIDAFSATDHIVRYLMLEHDNLTYLDEPLTEPMLTGVIFPKTEAGAALRAEFNAFLNEAGGESLTAELAEVWLGRDEAKKTVPDISGLSGENGTLVLATDATMPPYSFVKGNTNVGMDIDIILRFCKARGYALKIQDMSFGSLVDSVATGKCDFAAGAIAYTEERAGSVDFSDPVFRSYSVIAYLNAGSGPAAETGGRKSLDEMRTAVIGVLTGSNFAELVTARLPEAEILYFNSTADEVNALESGKIDAIATDEPVARSMQAENANFTILPEKVDTQVYAYIMAKTERGEALCGELSEYIRALKADGTLTALQNKWTDSADLTAVEMADYRTLPAVNGTVCMATFQYPPFIFLNNDRLTGYEIELMALFCRERGYALEIFDMNNEGVLPSVQSGKCDVGCCAISVTEERKESMLFSEPDYTGGTVLLVRKADAARTDFFASVRDSFEKTFLRESRWKLFLEGIGTTLLITAASILFGTLLGFLAFMLCRNGNPAANAITRFLVWLIRGMPVVVLLMILYYIIFGNVAISGTLVSVIGFTLVFGAGVYGIVRAGVAAVPPGQLEAAYALGYTNRRAFYRVILPQAMPHFMPAYKGSITELIKATAIVGYVAVQDLTKMGDIVRSRTYEAFFPLIAVAVIYFILAALLTLIVNRIELHLNPMRRTPEKIREEVEESSS